MCQSILGAEAANKSSKHWAGQTQKINHHHYYYQYQYLSYSIHRYKSESFKSQLTNTEKSQWIKRRGRLFSEEIGIANSWFLILSFAKPFKQKNQKRISSSLSLPFSPCLIRGIFCLFLSLSKRKGKSAVIKCPEVFLSLFLLCWDYHYHHYYTIYRLIPTFWFTWWHTHTDRSKMQRNKKKHGQRCCYFQYFWFDFSPSSSPLQFQTNNTQCELPLLSSILSSSPFPIIICPVFEFG